MSRTICFMDDEGYGTCSEEGIKEVVNCKKCSFYKKFKGKEKDNFSYTFWTGELKEKVKK